MIKFCQFETKHYQPLSFDKDYLYNNYDIINRFLVHNIDRSFTGFIAKPILSNYGIEWYSEKSNLSRLSENNKDTILQKYWSKIDLINKKIDELSRKSESTDREWAQLLKATFDSNNNIIYHNEEDVVVVWGWEFRNQDNTELNFIENSPKIIDIDEPSLPQDNFIEQNHDNEVSTETKLDEELEEDLTEEPIPVSEFFEEKELISENYFQTFAAKYYWLIPLLVLIALVIFFVKSLIY
jgi:hypothetical protein